MSKYIRLALILLPVSVWGQTPSDYEISQVTGDYWKKIYTECDRDYYLKSRDGAVWELRVNAPFPFKGLSYFETTTVADKRSGIEWSGISGYMGETQRSYKNGKWSDWIAITNPPHGLWPAVHLVLRNGHWTFDKPVAAWNAVPFSCSDIPPEHSAREEAAISAAQKSALSPQQAAVCEAFAREASEGVKEQSARTVASKNPVTLGQFDQAHRFDEQKYRRERELRLAEIMGGSFEKWRGHLTFAVSGNTVQSTLRFDCPAFENFDFDNPGHVIADYVLKMRVLAELPLSSPLAELLKSAHQEDVVEASGNIISKEDFRANVPWIGVAFQGNFRSICLSGGRCAGADSGDEKSANRNTSQGASATESIHGGGTVEGRHTLVIALQDCRATESMIACRYKVTRTGDFNGTLMTNWDDWQTALVDNLGNTHSLLRTLIARDDGTQVEMLPLNRGQSTLLVQEFEGSSNEVTSARILFGKFNSELHGPVRHEASGLQAATVPLPNRQSTPPSDSGDPYHPLTVPEEVQRQKLIYHPKPVYTAFARSARLQGAVRFKVLVNEDGSVGYLELISGNRLLATGAIDAVKQYRYSPTLVNGVPKKVWTEVTVSFP
jgi:TonB family protein